jgi:hypothetical protein
VDHGRSRASKRTESAAKILFLLIAILLVGLLGQAAAEPIAPSGTDAEAYGATNAMKATGTVDVEWRGGMGSPEPTGALKTAQVEVVIFTGDRVNQGEFFYRVFTPDGVLHREVRAVMQSSRIAGNSAIGCALVVSDDKFGGGGGGGGGCGGGCGGDEGGCDGHDDSCSDDEGGDTHDDSCSGEEGGCTHETGGETMSASSMSGEMGASGKNRLGQYVVVKLTDNGTPGPGYDQLAWHWFAPAYGATLDVTNGYSGHLCWKTILGGNLMIH